MTYVRVRGREDRLSVERLDPHSQQVDGRRRFTSAYRGAAR